MIITEDIEEHEITYVDGYTVTDLIDELRTFNQKAEIINNISIGWHDSRENTEYIAINYEHEFE